MSSRPRSSQHASLILASGLVIAGCSSSPKPATAPMLQSDTLDATESGIEAFERGNLIVARDRLERALATARRQGDPAQTAPCAQNLAACMIALGDLPRARDLLNESIADHARAGSSPAGALLLLAAAARQQRDTAAALASLSAVDQLPQATAQEKLLAAVTRALIACDLRDTAAARAALTTLRSNPTNQNLAITARIDELEARVLDLENNPAAAADAYERTAVVMRSAQLVREIAPMLLLASQAAERSAQPDRAAELAKQAAQVALGLKDLPLARTAIDRASSLCAASANQQLAATIAALAREVDRAESPTP